MQIEKIKNQFLTNKKILLFNSGILSQPKDREIYLKDILESGEVIKECSKNGKSYSLTASYNGAVIWNSIQKKQRTMILKKPIRIGQIGKGGQGDRIYSINGKSVCLSVNGGGRGAKTGLYKMKDYVRKLTPIECERLQCFPDNFTEGISNTRRYQTLGNAFNVEVIKHIIKFLI